MRDAWPADVPGSWHARREAHQMYQSARARSPVAYLFHNGQRCRRGAIAEGSRTDLVKVRTAGLRTLGLRGFSDLLALQRGDVLDHLKNSPAGQYVIHQATVYFGIWERALFAHVAPSSNWLLPKNASAIPAKLNQERGSRGLSRCERRNSSNPLSKFPE